MADTLIDKLRAAMDEDERIALDAGSEDQLFDGTGIFDGAYVEGPRRTVLPSHLAKFIAHNDPASVLRQVAAHREILKWAQEAIKMCTVSPGGVLSQPGEHMMGDIGRWNIEALAKAYGIEVPGHG